MSQKQLQRWKVLSLVAEGRMTLGDGTAKMGLSYREGYAAEEEKSKLFMFSMVYKHSAQEYVTKLAK